jgi:hypothetical protein
LKIIDSETGLYYEKSQIYENLRNLVKSANNNYGIGLGILTGSENRVIWSDAYSKLMKSNFILNENYYLQKIFIFEFSLGSSSLLSRFTLNLVYLNQSSLSYPNG